MTHFELKSTSDGEVIAVFEFDIGSYAGEASDDRVKTLFDLKSEKYYGSQIDIVLSIEHLDQLPEFLQRNVYGHGYPLYADQAGARIAKIGLADGDMDYSGRGDTKDIIIPAHGSNQEPDTEIEKRSPRA